MQARRHLGRTGVHDLSRVFPHKRVTHHGPDPEHLHVDLPTSPGQIVETEHCSLALDVDLLVATLVDPRAVLAGVNGVLGIRGLPTTNAASETAFSFDKGVDVDKPVAHAVEIV